MNDTELISQTNARIYKKSQTLLERALKAIPLGSQTFSKSMTQFPLGVSPHFIERGQGARVWDVDGNEYLDLVNGLLAVLLGYRDPDVDQAVLEQLQSGVSFSLAHPLEVAVAEKLIEMIPCAEMVRFGKNGSDATAGAIRLARAYTGKERVAVCGYHGWQDWYIGSTSRNLGVPVATQALTHRFTYNDLTSLEKLFSDFPNQFSAVILEPMYSQFPQNNFLQDVKTLTHKNGAILIFDEIITGFRLAAGGAQEYFGVTPDLATVGKGMGNGYPISAIVGRAELMSLMKDIFYSFTFGGEAISLAATLATLNKIQLKPVIETLALRGTILVNELKAILEMHQLHKVIHVLGHPACSSLSFRDADNYSLWEIKTYFMQEMLARGVLTFGSHNLSYAHSEKDIKEILKKYDDVFGLLKKRLMQKNLQEHLKCQTLKPLFSVR